MTSQSILALMNEFGISMYRSNSNLLSGNVYLYNDYGLWIVDSANNTISCNDISHNQYGIVLDSSSNNGFLHNVIDNTIHQVHDLSWYNPPEVVPPSINVWDDCYPSGGNYWSDYKGTDTNEDGIGDTPYIIDQNNRDNYPLMAPYIPPAQIRVLYYDLLKKFYELLSWYNLLNQTYQRLLGNITNLQGQIDSLNSTFQRGQESMIGELTNIRNLMYVFIALTTILMATTVYFAVRKPKKKP